MSWLKLVRQRANSLLLNFLFHLGLQWFGCSGRSALLTDSNVDLLQKHSHRHTPRMMFDQIPGLLQPSQADT